VAITVANYIMFMDHIDVAVTMTSPTVTPAPTGPTRTPTSSAQAGKAVPTIAAVAMAARYNFISVLQFAEPTSDNWTPD
jgi:hypothetical protein